MINIAQLGAMLGSQDSLLFNPMLVSGLQVWLDMTDISTISQTGSILTQLRDKSGNNNHSTPTGTQRGTIANNSLTGRQVLSVNGTTNYLPLTTELSNTSFSAFLVVKNTDIATLKVLMGATSNSDYVSCSDNGTIKVNNTTSGIVTYSRDGCLSELSVISIRLNSGVAIEQQYNNRHSFKASGTIPSTAQKIGQLLRNSGGFYMPGEFAGFIYYNNYVSDDNCFKVVRHLFDTHNLTPVTPSSKIVAFGDSITTGIGASTLTNGYAYQIATSLGKRISNAGISGTPFQSTGGAANNGYGRYSKQMVEYSYKDNLYVLYGTNDITGIAVGGTPALFQTEYDAMIKDLIARGYSADRIYLGTPPYRQGNGLASSVIAYGDAVRTVGQFYGCHVAEVYTAMLNGGGDTLMNDSVHPNDAGHLLIANTFLAS